MPNCKESCWLNVRCLQMDTYLNTYSLLSRIHFLDTRGKSKMGPLVEMHLEDNECEDEIYS